MRLTTQTVAEIKACHTIYRAADVARNYDIHRSTVKRIWDGQIHQEVLPAQDFPEIVVKPRVSELIEDVRILTDRGWPVKRIADYLNISERAVYECRGVWV